MMAELIHIYTFVNFVFNDYDYYHKVKLLHFHLIINPGHLCFTF